MDKIEARLEAIETALTPFLTEDGPTIAQRLDAIEARLTKLENANAEPAPGGGDADE